MKIRTLLTRWVLCCLLLVVPMLHILVVAQKISFKNNIKSESEQLVIELLCSSAKVNIKDQIAFDVKLINKGKEKLSINNTVELSYHTLMLAVKDETGNLVLSDEFWYLPPPSYGTASYISLFPNHYYGATLLEPAVNLFKKPGKYYVFAVYLSPVSENNVEEYFGIKNLWGRERNPIESSPVWIEVIGD